MKRLFYLFVLMGAFTVTQPGCGLLFFPFPDGEVEEPSEDVVEEMDGQDEAVFSMEEIDPIVIIDGQEEAVFSMEEIDAIVIE